MKCLYALFSFTNGHMVEQPMIWRVVVVEVMCTYLFRAVYTAFLEPHIHVVYVLSPPDLGVAVIKPRNKAILV